MKCAKARILLSASLDGELSRREQAALERHIAACAECAREKSEFASLRDAMALLKDEEPSPWLAENFGNRFRQWQQEKLAAKPGPRRWVFGTAATAAATVLVLAGFMLHGFLIQPPPRPQPVPAQVVKPNAAADMPDTQPQEETAPITESGPLVGETSGTGPEPQGTQVTASGGSSTAPPRRFSGTRMSDRRTGRTDFRRGDIATRDTDRDDKVEQTVAVRMAAAGAVGDLVTGPVADNIGEAGLAMNETVERVRGTLQKAVDLMAAEYTPPASNNLTNDGGDI